VGQDEYVMQRSASVHWLRHIFFHLWQLLHRCGPRRRFVGDDAGGEVGGEVDDDEPEGGGEDEGGGAADGGGGVADGGGGVDDGGADAFWCTMASIRRRFEPMLKPILSASLSEMDKMESRVRKPVSTRRGSRSKRWLATNHSRALSTRLAVAMARAGSTVTLWEAGKATKHTFEKTKVAFFTLVLFQRQKRTCFKNFSVWPLLQKQEYFLS